MRALIKIVKSMEPTVEDPDQWSDMFYEYLTQSLQKNPDDRVRVSAEVDDTFDKTYGYFPKVVFIL